MKNHIEPDLSCLSGIKKVDSPNGRKYVISEDISYPSITTVLDKSTDKEWLNRWQKRVGKKEAEKRSKYAADRGTELHELVELYLKNVEFDVNRYSSVPVKMFNKMKKFSLGNIDNIYLQELPIYSNKVGIAGTVDCIAEYKGVISVIDFKTSNWAKDEESIENYYIQECFYALAFTELFGINVRQLVTIIVNEKTIKPTVIIRDVADYVKLLLERKAFYDKVIQMRK